eukprot:GCRY01001212.1.p2 GENE.GCRY01001212.1~~GCRY01001212.1.p2  ORF type:complete len:125 (+),score=17.86 GCRY01001212.1:207-581(+)
MLRSSVLPDVLKQVKEEGVTGSFLFNSAGVLVASSNLCEEESDRTISAIGQSIFMLFNKYGPTCSEQDSLNSLLIECENAVVVIEKMDNLYLAVTGTPSLPCGLLFSKAASIRNLLLHAKESMS